MSISLIVLQPKIDEYALVNVPIASEEVFDRVWAPASEQLRSEWLPLFRSGVDLDGADFSEVSVELKALQQWVDLNVADKDERNSILFRIDNLLRKMSQLAFQTRGQLTVFIG